VEKWLPLNSGAMGVFFHYLTLPDRPDLESSACNFNDTTQYFIKYEPEKDGDLGLKGGPELRGFLTVKVANPPFYRLNHPH
jgi:hypothetical protein